MEYDENVLPGCVLDNCGDEIILALTPIEFCTGLDALWYDGDNDLPDCVEDCDDDEIITLA